MSMRDRCGHHVWKMSRIRGSIIASRGETGAPIRSASPARIAGRSIAAANTSGALPMNSASTSYSTYGSSSVPPCSRSISPVIRTVGPAARMFRSTRRILSSLARCPPQLRRAQIAAAVLRRYSLGSAHARATRERTRQGLADPQELALAESLDRRSGVSTAAGHFVPAARTPRSPGRNSTGLRRRWRVFVLSYLGEDTS